jgi:hypothetical protein
MILAENPRPLFRDHAQFNAKSPDVPGAVYIEGDLVIVMAAFRG